MTAEYGNPQWGGYADILCCDHCRELVYAVLNSQMNFQGQRVATEEILDYYPKRTPKLDESIPESVAEDYVEAIKCFDIGASRASAAMCRRALQSSVLERGAKKAKLQDQIDDLYKRQIITEAIRDWAHEIRLTGNIGAHPDEDGLEDVSSEDADGLIKFMEEYLNYVYIMPDKVAKKRAQKEEQRKPKE